MKTITIGVLCGALLMARTACAQMVVQPGVQGGLAIAVPLSRGSALIVQPGTPNPPAFIVGLSGGSAMIVQPPNIPAVDSDTDAAGVDDGSTSPDGSDGGDSDGGDLQ